MPLSSMTGFGRGTSEGEGRRFVVEVRAVNHRGLDLKVRLRDGDAFCEAEIARLVRGVLERGSVTVTVREEETGASPGLNPERIRQAHALLDRVAHGLGLPRPVDLATVGVFLSSTVSAGPGLRGEALWQLLRPGVVQALDELREMRRREGAALAQDLGERLDRLRRLRAELAQGAASLPGESLRRLEERLSQLSGTAGMDPSRLAQEAVLLAERLDVSEELVRLGAHLDELSRLLSSGDGGKPVGRRLEFLIQEVGRELNTTGSKIQEPALVGLVIEAKVELEKIREQAQNIE